MSASALPPELALDDEPFTEDQLDVIADMVNSGLSLEAVTERIDPLAQEPWSVHDLSGAEWAMRIVAAVDEEAELVDRQHREWRERVDRWHDTAMQRLRGRRAFFAYHLARYALAERERSGGKLKSLTLPSGNVRTTETKPRAEVVDDASVIAWVREHLAPAEVAQVVKVTEKPLVSELRKLVRIVEVVDEARVTFHCGCVAVVPAPLPGLGDGVTCPVCASEALVGRIEVTAAHSEVRDAATGEQVVLGVAVDPGGISASVMPT